MPLTVDLLPVRLSALVGRESELGGIGGLVPPLAVHLYRTKTRLPGVSRES
jgi:hypothetical protein